MAPDRLEDPGSEPAVTDSALRFPDVPRLELDQLITQLIDRAQDVLAAQGRLRGLLTANSMIVGDLALPTVLRHIVEAACQLVHARYGALGVLASDGRGLEEFVYVGMDDAAAKAIGRLPEGKGLVGALTDDGRPIRLRRLADDPRSVGLPENHPPMEGFLGVPVRVRSEVFGNLYLTEPESGEFTAEDEELVVALAATAGVAIENARLYEQAGRRQQWLAASAEITRQLLTGVGEQPLQLISHKVRAVSDADIATVVIRTRDDQHLRVEVASGQRADDLTGVTYPIENTLAGLAFDSHRPVSVGDVAESGYSTPINDAVPVGPVMVVPMIGTTQPRGALVVARLRGRRRFEEVELDMATTFANHAALALELADARDDQQRMLLLEDRDRIARDLHDHVIQRLFAAGLSLEAASSLGDSPEQAARLTEIIEQLDETIRQIRTSIFQLRGALVPEKAGARTRILGTVREATPLLGFEPDVRFGGPIDVVVSEPVLDDLLAVIREGLANVARHANASRTEIDVNADSQRLSLVIADDGIGIGDTTRRSGLANLAERAEQHRGEFTFTDGAAGTPGDGSSADSARTRRGTRLRWTIPLR